jgi:hypothetical protein
MLENFLLSLNIMWRGMFGIFTVIIIITLLVVLLQKLDVMFPAKNEDSDN